jgi:hypothetical protein
LDDYHSGAYKGIPWKSGCTYSAEGTPREIHFATPVFHTFLSVRKVLLPVVRSLMVSAGGFSILGTAFRWKERTWHLFGRPGAGKTSLLLSCLSQGAQLIGDFELLVSRDGVIRPLMDDIEFRYATVSSTPFWKRLNHRQQLWLLTCRLISGMTARRISFNLVVPPRSIAIPRVEDDALAPNVLAGIGIEEWNPNESVDDLLAYFRHYDSIYPPIFSQRTSYWDDLEANLRRYVESCDLAGLPAGVVAEDLTTPSLTI